MRNHAAAILVALLGASPALRQAAAASSSELRSQNAANHDINDVFLELPSMRTNTAWVDARDLKDGHIGDYVHYNSEAQAVIGRRFAEQSFQLITATASKQ